MPIQQQVRRPSLKSAQRTLSQEQLRRILDLVKKHQSTPDLYEVVTIISNTGIRAGELRQLRWAHVDVYRRRLVVNAESGYMRFVPFGPKTLQILEVRREREPDTEYVMGKSPLTFLHRISYQLRRVCERNGLNNVTLHLLRRTFFARLLDSGASLESCMTFSGRRSPSLALKSILNADRRFEIAARDQARIEEQ